MKNYQLIINDDHRNTLAKIRQQTGLTISALTEYCFRERMVTTENSRLYLVE
ncbi:hypothetical protein [Sporosarcina sp. NPDC096371]|uniref:hypothetical protein n=1 Tax=Sporosarcina sp. NPDC096371 TaxID=3364530 RepID=UPI00382CCE0E